MAHRAESSRLIELTHQTERGSVKCLLSPEGARLERFESGISRPFFAGEPCSVTQSRAGRTVGLGRAIFAVRHHRTHSQQFFARFSGEPCFFSGGVRSHSNDSVALVCNISNEPSYPHSLTLLVCYDLNETELKVTISAVNVGSSPAPIAFGAHPFLCLGALPTHSLTVTALVETQVTVDERLLPLGSQPLDANSP
jgi:hypothetical protein